MHEAQHIIPTLIAAARRAPTPAGLASVEAALRGEPTPAAYRTPFDQVLVWDHPEHRLPVAVPPEPAAAVRLDPPAGLDPDTEPDPAFDWMYRPHPRRARN